MERTRLLAKAKEYLQKRREEKLKELLKKEKVLERYERMLRKRRDHLTRPVIEYRLIETKQRIKELQGV